MVKTNTVNQTRTSMGTRAMVTGVFVSVGVVLIGWQFAAAGFAASTDPVAGTISGTVPNTSANGAQSSSSGQATGSQPSGGQATGTALSKNGTFTGSSVNTPFGSVQVAVTVSGGAISEVSALHLTDQGGRSVQISNYAAPILRNEVLQSQSAQVNMVSGATYTSEAYLTSLQSALDQIGK